MKKNCISVKIGNHDEIIFRLKEKAFQLSRIRKPASEAARNALIKNVIFDDYVFMWVSPYENRHRL